ncbi:MAG TPA: tRNA-modifying protein YgfZ [Buchnera sp. (in: enterobacteria)]|nr:tRNA-modifying protein YgfZ [Buchnera sp. (in: enterobacteria)]
MTFKNVVFSSCNIPLSLMYLDDWSCVIVEGTNSKKYLQGQLTIDTSLLQMHQHIICAHCNINGKIWSVLRLLNYKTGYIYIQPDDVSDIQIHELQKYAIFSNITIRKENNLLLFGISGLNAKMLLMKFFSKIPNQEYSMVNHEDITLLWFKDPIERFLLIVPKNNTFIENIKKEKVFLSTSNQWAALDIESGYPIITRTMMNKFLPLSVNLEKLGGINFKKGCYYGQEVIAKIKFKHLNKRSLYWIQSVKYKNKLPNIGRLIEIKKHQNWFIVGHVVFAVVMYNDMIWVQAILDSNLNINSVLRINGYDDYFYIKKSFSI